MIEQVIICEQNIDKLVPNPKSDIRNPKSDIRNPLPLHLIRLLHYFQFGMCIFPGFHF
jgi:hypothetical protein